LYQREKTLCLKNQKNIYRAGEYTSVVEQWAREYEVLGSDPHPTKKHKSIATLKASKIKA
jgi:hypothetical protein